MSGGLMAAAIWSQPVRLFDVNRTKQLLSALPRKAGVYRIRVLNAEGRPVLLRRLSCDDPEGILDIGEAGDTIHTNLSWRIEAFQNAVLDGKTYHAAGLRFHDYQYEDRFPLHTLWVDWIVKPDKKAARDYEERLLAGHRRRFLDPPPLNCKA
ncbi:MAG: hypothetical protein WAU82_06175 [Candidatus Binatus sp.]